MSLISLKSIKDDFPDAFIRLDFFNSIIGYPFTDGNFIWYIDGISGDFSNCHAYLKSGKAPENAGIFKILDSNAELYWYFGDINKIKEHFQKVAGFNSVDEIKPSEKEAEPIPDESVLYEELQKTPPESFWDCNQLSFNEILTSNPENTILSELIPGSKWVNVEDYVLGVIYDESDLPLYICYGFPLPWSETPPEKLEGYCQWVPVDFQKPHEEGFWVIYINAQTGERVR